MRKSQPAPGLDAVAEAFFLAALLNVRAVGAADCDADGAACGGSFLQEVVQPGVRLVQEHWPNGSAQRCASRGP